MMISLERRESTLVLNFVETRVAQKREFNFFANKTDAFL